MGAGLAGKNALNTIVIHPLALIGVGNVVGGFRAHELLRPRSRDARAVGAEISFPVANHAALRREDTTSIFNLACNCCGCAVGQDHESKSRRDTLQDIDMTQRSFIYITGMIGLAFAIAFAVLVLPSLMKDLSIVTALSSGFVNPYSTGFSLDTLSSWLVLTVWIVYEARSSGIRHGWIAILLGLIPGTATGFAFYLILRTIQLRKEAIPLN